MAIISAFISAFITANIAADSSEWSAYGTTFIDAKQSPYSNAIIAAIGAADIAPDWTTI